MTPELVRAVGRLFSLLREAAGTLDGERSFTYTGADGEECVIRFVIDGTDFQLCKSDEMSDLEISGKAEQ